MHMKKKMARDKALYTCLKKRKPYSMLKTKAIAFQKQSDLQGFIKTLRPQNRAYFDNFFGQRFFAALIKIYCC